MRFALHNNEKVEAQPDLQASCPGCGKPVIAKCGERRIHHWAHRNNKNCDSWWEPETEWHRSWKNNFPDDWQEVFLVDAKTKELHIADVRTSHGLVVEFQHSHINPIERRSRESFYKNMVWVVDGTRLIRDYKRFAKEKKSFYAIKPNIFSLSFVEECLPVSWIESQVPVVFDFYGNGLLNNLEERQLVYCLFPKRFEKSAILAQIPRAAFIKTINNGEWLSRVNNFISMLSQEYKKRKELEDQIRSIQGAIHLQKHIARWRSKRTRRW